ncbi:MAG TPA: metallophosphoesterase family protein [Anaeromyxobacteraceae bacterium]|nr:metallophosphoesterase family protein [Anaeromyxobacteraceae bacterium]
MKIGLASDSFGNVDALAAAFERLVKAGAERIFFLGGRYADVEAALARKRAGVRDGSAPLDGDESFLRAVEGVLDQEVSGRGADEAGRLERRIVRVASRACPEYQQDRAPRKVFEMVTGLICCLVHDKSELSRDDIANASVLFHGNSGRAAMVAIGPRVFVTPGHLRALDPDGRPPSYALLEVGPEALELVVYSPSGDELRREKLEVGARSKMSVK